MGDKEYLIPDKGDEPAPKSVLRAYEKLPWYLGSGFILFWVLLFFAVVIPYTNRLPTALTMEDANKNVFITELAYKNLYTLFNIGNKLTGSKENEIDAVQFLLTELNKIKEDSLKDYFDIEIDLSQVSGTYKSSITWTIYQGVQNIAVKISAKNSTSESYLLVNSHFDSEASTSSAGDAGFMIVTMLEVLRVIATKKQTFDHPIVFLFNGAEEGGMLASHGFITKHKWAPNCKAVVNLDAAGSGGKEILFQSGPNHPWLVNYYKKHIKHPFATTMAEELFQAGFIPSNTDFRQFNKYGNIPGLDLAQITNGYVYHTKYDTIDIIPRESLQNTGDNVLHLVRGLANATELHDTQAHAAGHAIFFDFLGIYFINYSEATGISLNFGVSAAALILIFVSMWRMAEVSQVSFGYVASQFILVLIIQIISCTLAVALPLVVAHAFDTWGLSLAYYSTRLLVIGLYVCPSLIGLCLPLTIYNSLQRNDKIKAAYHIQLSLHGQAVILAISSIGLTILGLRSTYIFVLPLMFYVISLAFNLLTTLHDRGFAWSCVLKACQIIPFLYSSYLFYILIDMFTPIAGRASSLSYQDLNIAALAAAGTILSFGFLIPLINSYRRSSFVVLALLAITAISIFLASCTHLGFPYRPKTSGQRVFYVQARNMFFDYDGALSKDESGYLFNFEDRLKEKHWGTKVNLTGLVGIESNCDAHMMCGMPMLAASRLNSKWLPRSEPIEPPKMTSLSLIRKTALNSTAVRFEFQLKGPPFTNLVIQPYEDVALTDWSFTINSRPPPSSIPYIIFFKYGINNSPLHFMLELSKPNIDIHVPLFQLGVSSYFMQDKGDAQSVRFASSFPSYAILSQFPALYQRYIF